MSALILKAARELRSLHAYAHPKCEDYGPSTCPTWAVIHELEAGFRSRVVDTWNGGKAGRVIVFTSQATGDAGNNECFAWVHANTPFSFSEATTRQGYVVELAE